MFGVIVNALGIFVAAIIGVTIGHRIPKKIQEAVMVVVPLCVLIIGISSALQGDTLVTILSLVIGTSLGTLWNLEDRLDGMGIWLKKKFIKKDGKQTSTFVEGFVAASLVYCVGSMAILGSLEGGIQKTYDILYAKTILDSISCVIFATTLGIGVAFSALSVFVYQGAITLLAGQLSPLFSPEVIENISGVGGIMIIALAIKMLNLKDIKAANMLPAILGPLIFELIQMIFGR